MKKIWLVLIVLILLVGIGYFFWRYFSKEQENKLNGEPSPSAQSWQEQGVAVSGTYADAEVVALGDGRYRMYYSAEPEASKNLEVYSATSTDGINWTKEDGLRKEMAVFPDVIKLPDGKWRLYFQEQQEIKSAVSADGLNWQDEPGTRIDKNETGYTLESVGAQSTSQLDDGTYIMMYRGTINEPYKTTEKLPNQETHLYFWATAEDGLTFEKKGIAFDSRNETLLGATDGAEWVKWDSSWRLYFWSYRGVFHLTYENGQFSEPVFDFTNKPDSFNKFPENPPADPTLVKINNQWFMYYGQHTKGIYYAVLK